MVPIQICHGEIKITIFTLPEVFTLSENAENICEASFLGLQLKI